MFLYHYNNCHVKCYPFKLSQHLFTSCIFPLPNINDKYRLPLTERKPVSNWLYCHYWLPCNTLWILLWMQNSQYHPSFHSMLPCDHLKKRRKKEENTCSLQTLPLPSDKGIFSSPLKSGAWGHSKSKINCLCMCKVGGSPSTAIWHFPRWCGVQCIAPNFSGGSDNCKMPRPLFTLKSETGTRAGAVCLTQGWQQWCHAARQEQPSPFSAEPPQFQHQNQAGSSLPAQG